VFEASFLWEEKMTDNHRRLAEEVAQGVLLDDLDFLREIAARVAQELLEAEMTEHLGAAPTNAASPARDTAMAASRGC
jgi:transposase-like protein